MRAQASILHYAQSITSAASERAAVVDCVIVVPPFFGPAQRQALTDAAELAGMCRPCPLTQHTLLQVYRCQRWWSSRVIEGAPFRLCGLLPLPCHPKYSNQYAAAGMLWTPAAYRHQQLPRSCDLRP